MRLPASANTTSFRCATSAEPAYAFPDVDEDANDLVLLLPERRRFSGQAISPWVGRQLGRADSLCTEPGERAQLLRYFDLFPRGWPMAALTRQFDVGDAAAHCWLRADPVYVQPDMTGARLMAWGNLELSDGDAEELLLSLRPIFGDAGFALSSTAPERWYLQVASGSPLPEFTPPYESLGEDLLGHLPQGDAARRWRVLLNEAQVILHNHPLNSVRAASGKPPVNSLWFWGGGELPLSVRCRAGSVLGSETELLALARAAEVADSVVPREGADGSGMLLDLRRERSWASLESGALGVALREWRGTYASLCLDFADGTALRVRSGQAWRVFRKSLGTLAP